MSRLCLFLAGYLLGSIQFGYLYGRMKGIDIREFGSRNTGATNSLRVMGTGAGLAVLLGDALKALLPCLAVRFLWPYGPEPAALRVLWIGTGVILGHCFPFYLGFQGGKGVASTIGFLLALSFPLGLGWIAVFFLGAGLSRYVSLGSIMAMIYLAASLTAGAVTGRFGLSGSGVPEFIVLGLVIPVLSVWRHRTNIGRLIRGEENKVKLFTKGMDTGTGKTH